MFEKNLLKFNEKQHEVISDFMCFYSKEPRGYLINLEKQPEKFLCPQYWDDVMPIIKACSEAGGYCPYNDRDEYLKEGEKGYSKEGEFLLNAWEIAMQDLDEALYTNDCISAWNAIFPFVLKCRGLKLNS